MEMYVSKSVGAVTIELDNESAEALAECLENFTCGWTDLTTAIQQCLESSTFVRPILHDRDDVTSKE